MGGFKYQGAALIAHQSILMSHKNPGKLRAGEYYFDLLILFGSIVVLVLAYRISGFALSAAGTFPMASSSVMVLSMLLVLYGNRKKERENTGGFASELRQTMHEVFTKEFVVYSLMLLVYALAIEPTHFLPSSFVFICLSIIYLKGSTPGKAVLISTGTLACIYVVFLYFFKVLLP